MLIFTRRAGGAIRRRGAAPSSSRVFNLRSWAQGERDVTSTLDHVRRFVAARCNQPGTSGPGCECAEAATAATTGRFAEGCAEEGERRRYTGGAAGRAKAGQRGGRARPKNLCADLRLLPRQRRTRQDGAGPGEVGARAA